MAHSQPEPYTGVGVEDSKTITGDPAVDEVDLDKGGRHVTEIEVLAENIDKAAEARMVRKMDMAILPVLAIVYLFNALDKGNISNAKTDGLDKDIGLKGNDWSLIISLFYLPLCLCGTPLAMLAKRYSAARVIPCMMLGFGSMSLCAAGVTNFGGLLAVRMLLGVFESPMLASVVYYLSTFWTRGELARRIGIFYAASSISGAFSGLLAFGIFQIKSDRLHGWQYLFLIEGSGTLLFAAFALFWLPRSPATCWFFTEEEKEMSRIRLLRDGSSTISQTIDVRDAFMPFVQDWRYIVWGLLALGLGVPLASVGNFLPQIVQRLGYSVIKTNLYTVAPNIVGTVCLLGFTFSSDFFRERSLHVVVPLLITMVGFVILGCIDVQHSIGVGYMACFFLCIGANTPSVMLSTWYSNNSISESRRAVLAGVMVAIANSSGLISGNIFRSQDAPKYIPALATSAAIGGLTAVGALAFGMYMRVDNRRRNKAQGLPSDYGSKDVPTELLGRGPDEPAYRWFY